MGRYEIVPTYRVPTLVRAPGNQVVLKEHCANRRGALFGAEPVTLVSKGQPYGLGGSGT